MKRMRKIVALALALAMAMSISACGNSETPEASGNANPGTEQSSTEEKKGDPIKIKLCAIDPAEQRTNLDLQTCIDEIYERTDGMIDIQLYTDGQMLVYAEGIEAVMSNANVISVSPSSYLSDYFPIMSVFTTPYVFPSREVAMEFYNGEYFQKLKEECEAGGVHIICADALTGFRSMIATTPIQSVDDLRKLNMRITTMDGLVKLFENMGCNYQVFPFSECFNALQTGAIDGLENTPTGVIVGHFSDAVSPLYYSLTNHIMDGYCLMVGQEFWMSIPEEYRVIIDEVLGGWGKMTTANIVEDEKVLFDQMEASGIKVLEVEDLSEFRAYGAEVVAGIEGGDEVLAEIAKIEASLG